MPDSLMDLLRRGIGNPEIKRQALALAERQQAVVDLIGTITLCPDCEGTRTRKRDGAHACCRLGHARDCQCALCQWIRAGKRWEQKEIAQQAEIGRLGREREEALDASEAAMPAAPHAPTKAEAADLGRPKEQGDDSDECPCCGRSVAYPAYDQHVRRCSRPKEQSC